MSIPTPQDYISIPVTKTAMQWDPAAPEPVLAWLREHDVLHKVYADGSIAVGGLESGEDELDRHKGGAGYWIIMGVLGEFYLCADEAFKNVPVEQFAEAFARAGHTAWHDRCVAEGGTEHLVHGQNALVGWEELPSTIRARDLALAAAHVALLAKLNPADFRPAEARAAA